MYWTGTEVTDWWKRHQGHFGVHRFPVVAEVPKLRHSSGPAIKYVAFLIFGQTGASSCVYQTHPSQVFNVALTDAVFYIKTEAKQSYQLIWWFRLDQTNCRSENGLWKSASTLWFHFLSNWNPPDLLDTDSLCVCLCLTPNDWSSLYWRKALAVPFFAIRIRAKRTFCRTGIHRKTAASAHAHTIRLVKSSFFCCLSLKPSLSGDFICCFRG